MWFRTGIFAILSVRRMKNVGFGFWPAAREWKIGALYFAGLAPVAAAAGWALHFASPHLRYAGWERTTLIGLATFFGILWVVALGEEFFFRGLLQQWIAGWLRSDWARFAAGGAAIRLRPPVVPRVPELAVRSAGRYRRRVLRNGVPAGAQHPRIHGHARLDGHGVALVLLLDPGPRFKT